MLKKNGFTLVEIMVVIIVMGVLAAVGVPKMFGVIAKAKASEVPVAAGTYISLQNAYLQENNGVGSWKNIGYGAPDGGKSEYFEYKGCIQGTIPFSVAEPGMPGWTANNITRLNSCKSRSTWAVIIDPAGENAISYQQLVSTAECAMLTHNWDIGSVTEGMCEATAELHKATPKPPEDDPEEEGDNDSSEPEPGSSPTGPASSSSAKSSQSQGDCEALSKAIKNENGNKFGWVCVSECGTFAPPGKARNSGFTGNYQKKKNSSTCEKTTPDSGSGSNGQGNSNNGNNDNSSAAPQSSASNSESAANTVESSNSTSGSGNGGNGGGTEGNGGGNGSPSGTSNAQQNYSATQVNGTSSSTAPTITDQSGNPISAEDYENIPDEVCTTKITGKGCQHNSTIPKSECEIYNTSTKICTKKKSS